MYSVFGVSLNLILLIKTFNHKL